MPRAPICAQIVLACGLLTLATAFPAQGETQDVVNVLQGHADTVEAVAINTDGTLIATASFDQTIKLFELASGAEIRTYGGEQGHRGQVLSVGFNRKGDQLATGGADNFARIWEIPTSKPLNTIAASEVPTRVIVAADGKTVAYGTVNGAVSVLPNGEEKRALELKGHSGAVTHLAAQGANWVSVGADHTLRFWSADGKPVGAAAVATSSFTGLVVGPSVFTASDDGIIRQWQLPTQVARAFPALKDAVTAFAASTDGNTIATAAADKTVTISSVSNNQAKGTFTGASAAIESVALSPDASAVAAGCADGKVILWGRQARVKIEIEAHAGGVTALEFHPSQPILYTSGADGQLKGWVLPIDPRRSEAEAVKPAIKAHAGRVTSLALDPPTGRLISAGADKFIRVWDPGNPSKPLREIGPLTAPATALAISRDGQLLAAAAGNEVVLWNPGDGKETARFKQSAEVLALGFSADKARLLIGRSDNLAALLDVRDGTVWQTFQHAGPVRGVLAHPSTSTVITASMDKSVVVSPIAVQRIIALGGKPLGLILSPDNQRIIAIGPGRSCAVFNAGSGQKERDLAVGNEALSAAVTKDGQRLAVAATDGSIKLYSLGDGKLLGEFQGGGAIGDLAFHPTLPQLAGSRKAEAIVWNVAVQPGQPTSAEFGRIVQTFAHPHGLAAIAFNGEGHLLTAGAEKLVRQFRIASSAPIKNLQHPNLVDCVAFDGGGSRLATGCHDGVLRIWDLPKNAVLKSINAHVQTSPQNAQNPIYAVRWSPDDKQIYTASFDRTVKLWDVASGNLVREFKAAPGPTPIEPKKDESKKGEPKKDDRKKEASKSEKVSEAPGLPGHRDQVFSMALTTDGKQLATGSSDRTLKLWDVATGRVVREFANRDLKPVLPGESAPSHPGWVQCVRLTPDDRYLVSAGPAPRGKAYLAVWRVADGQQLYGAEHDFGAIHSVAVTPDGTKLVLGCAPARGKPGANALIIKLPGR